MAWLKAPGQASLIRGPDRSEGRVLSVAERGRLSCDLRSGSAPGGGRAGLPSRRAHRRHTSPGVHSSQSPFPATATVSCTLESQPGPVAHSPRAPGSWQLGHLPPHQWAPGRAAPAPRPPVSQVRALPPPQGPWPVCGHLPARGARAVASSSFSGSREGPVSPCPSPPHPPPTRQPK